MRELLKGFFLGGVFVMFVVFIALTIANLAFGDDTIIEHDYILTYKYTTPDGVEFEHEITVYFEAAPDIGAFERCEATNRRLAVSKATIAKYIKAYPKYAHVFDEALKVIKDTWCYGNDN